MAESERHPRLGYGMAFTAATLWAVNGVISKVIIESGGVAAPRLTEVRTTGAFLILAAALALVRPESLRVRRSELPVLLTFGLLGLAFVQWFYFEAISRLDIGVALLIQYIAPVLVALWARFAYHEPVRRRIWAALALSILGIALLVELWSGLTLDGLGVAAALGSAVTFAVYILSAERAVTRRDPVSLVCYGFLLASIFWAVLQPWTSFPVERVDESVSLLGRLEDLSLPVWLLMGWMVVLGTIVPFALLAASLRHIPASRAAITAMFEPVAATVFAYAWLGESLTAFQLIGALVVLGAILLAQTAR
ncbi:MAG TPA: EamA family transporter [Gaiellaceae bacterium]|nr:EamA family transporter [Gaiellaceae bacterium]